jgi:hypothetical protein
MPDRLERACQQARAGGDGRLRTIRGVLERGIEDDPREPIPFPTPKQRLGAYLRGPDAFLPAEGHA